MKLNQLVRTTILVFTLALGLGISGARAFADDEDEQNVEIKDLTPDVQKTFNDHLGGGHITRVVKESENGKTLYSADVQKPDGEKLEIKVAEDGKLVRVNPNEDEENDNEGEDHNLGEHED